MLRRQLLLGIVAALVGSLFPWALAWCLCTVDCRTVSPVDNVPVNVETSGAVHITLDAELGYRFWATGDSYHAPDGCGRYTDVLAASAYTDGDAFSIPIGGEAVVLAPKLTPGERMLSLFFLEFGSGYLGDNSGATTVYYEPLCGGDVRSVVVSPVDNVIFNLNGSNAQVTQLNQASDYAVYASGTSQYATVGGVYRGAFVCMQWGCDTYLKAVPIDANGILNLPATGTDFIVPAYLWFPEFGDGYLGDNHGQTQVCFRHDRLFYDAYAEYASHQAGTSGVWRYEYEQGGYWPMNWEQTPCWSDSASAPSDSLGWFGPLHEGLYCLPGLVKPISGQLLRAHPGQTGGLPGYGAVLEFTAPASGQNVTIHAEFRKIHPGGDGIDIVLVRNGDELRSLTLAPEDLTPHTFDQTLNLEAGDLIRLIGRTRGDNSWDLYEFNMQVGYSALVAAVQPPARPLPALAGRIQAVVPNPFNSSVQIRLKGSPALSQDGSLEIFDVSGRLVRSIPGRAFEKSGQMIAWDGRDNRGEKVAAGLYTLRLRGSGAQGMGKVVYLP
jgi:hypothetical protein